ncbi:MAG TPA: DNA polymerase/3'-5' exonuclease PolX, partial [Candidatus Nanoarchaeia archaeon]|nr:DNA polymerase/3'-5' exonuclease PolX [Candidatus Nanoarchaeia archaeon]
QNIDTLSEDIEQVWKENRLTEISGIGEGITKKIDEFLKNNKSLYLEKLKKDTPVDLEQLRKIEGLGPKRIMKIYRELGVKNTEELKNAALSKKIRTIEGLGPVVETNILKAIEFSKKSGGRFSLFDALLSAEEIKNSLKQLKEVDRVEIAGSVRRMKETIGDIDILVTSKNSTRVMDFFTKMKIIADVIAKGETKSSVKLKNGMQADLRVIPDEIFGAGLMYFTGSQQHNIVLRRIAIQKGMKLSEYGIFENKKNKRIAGATEPEMYEKLGLDYIEPEMRESNGEIELSQNKKLPNLIGYNEIKGDLQMHTKWSDGSNSVEEMALMGKKLGYEYICITDHTGNLAVANALNEKRIILQRREIDKINKKISGIKILHGAEVNIKSDGLLDMPNKVLKQLDIVVASIHSGFKNPKEIITKRLTKAMENKNVDIIAHPTGRLIGKREEYQIDFEKVFEAAKKTGTLMEINSQPDRLDLKDVYVKSAVEKGVKLVISTDAHTSEQLKLIRLGIGTARRGWARKSDVVNTKSLKDMMSLLKH